MLARPAEAINVGDVLRLMEGGRRAKNASPSADPFAEMWKAVDGAVSAVVDRTTFAELARQWREKQTTYVPNWEI